MAPQNHRRTQREEILGEFVRALGRPVAAWILAKHSLQYNARIHELRKLGFRITSEVKLVNGVKHGYFRLVTGPAVLPKVTSTSEQSESTKLFSDGEMLSHDFDLEHLPD